MKVMQEAAWALGYAHERGVIHRDVKPDNVMIEEATDRTIVMDFGIAVKGAGESTGEVIGTARYMSPEQACGEAVDGRSDLYALGATVFFALTGRAPFEAKSVPALLAQQVATPAPRLLSLSPQLPQRLGAVVDQCLEKTPEARFPSGEDLAQALDALRGRELRAPPLVRSFLRNAQVSTMVFLATTLAGQGTVSQAGDVKWTFGGSGIIGTILFVQLIIVARRLLREGYTFADIRTALLAEAQMQDEEADSARSGKWIRRLNSLWQRIWAGRIGRWFFKVAGIGIRAPEGQAVPSADRTELVLGRSVEEAYGALTREQRSVARDLPEVVGRLEARAAGLRARGKTGPELTNTVAALENLRLALLRLSAGAGSVKDLTAQLERAREIGYQVDAALEADEALRGP
jgi:hypothetical protein